MDYRSVLCAERSVIAWNSNRTHTTVRGGGRAPRAFCRCVAASAASPPTYFWREEMSDGVIEGNKEMSGASTIGWTGIVSRRTRCICSGSTPSPRICWNSARASIGIRRRREETTGCILVMNRGLWGQVVSLMNEEGFELLPYYSTRGVKGITVSVTNVAASFDRENAYTHIQWSKLPIADITDLTHIATSKRCSS